MEKLGELRVEYWRIRLLGHLAKGEGCARWQAADAGLHGKTLRSPCERMAKAITRRVTPLIAL